MILFFGPPGSGKSVQGKLLVEKNGWQWLSTGEIFRESQDPELLERLSSGELIDDQLTNKIVDKALHDAHDDKRVVLDGYPRNPAQAAWLEEHLPKHGREIGAIVVFETPRDELIKRLAVRGRKEDSLAVIEKRLQIYHLNTKPVLDYYRQHGVRVITINGLGEVHQVHDRINKALEQCLPV